jgi:ketosteroid isomerase-like protein
MTGNADAFEQRIRDYFDACNTGDASAVAAHFEPDAVHYFPAGAAQGTFAGADAIGAGWASFVARLGSQWSVDHVLVDAARREAVIEWTHTKPGAGGYLRGDEWYRFSERGLIAEIRAYYACPVPDPSGSYELGDFPYAERGYPMP